MLHRIAHRVARGRFARLVAGFALALSLGTLAGTAQAQQQGGEATTQFGGQAPGGAQGEAQPFDIEQFQDWVVRCGRRQVDGVDACEMIQQRQDEDGQTVLAVAVGKVPNTNDPGMLIILPLGIWLPPGVVLKVDEGEEIPARVERCERRGCEVELLLDANILARLKAGNQANVLFQIYTPEGVPQTVGVPFSLLGFTAALNKVMT